MKSLARDGDSALGRGTSGSTGGGSSTGWAVMVRTVRRRCDGFGPTRLAVDG